MPPVLKARELVALAAAADGDLFRIQPAGRYVVKRSGVEATVTTAGRILAAAGFVVHTPLPPGPTGDLWERVTPTAAGMRALWRRDQDNDGETA